MAYQPFTHFPPELLSEIFTYTLYDGYPLLGTRSAPWIFLSVCRYWREMSISTPKLWSRFEIDMNIGEFVKYHLGSEPNPYLLHILEQWIRLSGDYPRLSVKVTYVPRRSLDATATRIVHALIPHIARCQALDFSVPNACIEPLFRAPPLRFQQLRALTLRTKLGDWPNQRLDVMQLGICWKHITHLDLDLEHRDSSHLMTLDTCLTIMNQATELVSFTVSARCLLGKSAADIERVDLPALQTLHLIVQGEHHPTSDIGQFISFLDRINASALKSLQLDWLLPTDSMDDMNIPLPQYTTLLSFLRRSSGTLDAFRMSYIPLSALQLVECLLVLPNVTTLELRFSQPTDIPAGVDPINPTFFDALTLGIRDGTHRNRGRCVILPILQSFTLECHGSTRYDYPRAIETFLRERSRMGLKRFGLFTEMRFTGLSDPRTAHRWKSRGVHLDIRSLTVR